MAKISDGTYPAATELVPTALTYQYDPTDVDHPDKTIDLTLLAKAASVVNQVADDAEITVGAESTNVRAITVQLKDGNGDDLTAAAVVDLVVFSSAAATALSSGGSTGLAIGADGMIIATVVAKKHFRVKTDATGKITLTWTDSGTDAAYLGVVLPDGRVVIGAAMTNAA